MTPTSDAPEQPPAAPHVLPGPAETDRYIHSDIFDRLVVGPDDLVGLVAYGLYQRRKREWLDAYRAGHARVPSEQELKDHSFAYRDNALAALQRHSAHRTRTRRHAAAGRRASAAASSPAS